MLKFSPANAKIEALKHVKSIAQYLENKRKVFSLDLLSGWSCPGANECLSRVRVGDNGKRTIHDGPNTQFRCFSASQEVLFSNVYNSRKHNTDLIRSTKNVDDCTELLMSSLPQNLGVCRIHVAGDFMNEAYMWAWGNVAIAHPDKLFYAYTKSLNYWVNSKEWFDNIPNLVLTASYGSRFDAFISLYGLRHTKVIFHPSEANGLEIDHDDSHAADPAKRDQNFALLIHGTQPKDSKASVALRVLKNEGVQFAYSR